jgi:TPR repeat protein
MFSLRQFLVYTSMLLLWAGWSAAADLASGKHAYEAKDFATAFKEFTPLAEQGNADAQFFLGKMYFAGQGVLKDIDRALKWLTASATQGNADAQLFLGSYHLLPHRDIAQGLKWLRLSAEQGNQDAQLLLGKSYMEGNRELPRDPVQGEMWLWLAAKDNLPFYQGELATAESHMTQDEIVKGKALAAAWKPKPGLKPDEKPGSGEKPKL